MSWSRGDQGTLRAWSYFSISVLPFYEFVEINPLFPVSFQSLVLRFRHLQVLVNSAGLKFDPEHRMQGIIFDMGNDR